MRPVTIEIKMKTITDLTNASLVRVETPRFAGWFNPEVIAAALRVGAEVRNNPRRAGETLTEYTRRLKELA